MDYLTVKETAELKGCSVRYINRLIQNGKMQAEIRFDDTIKQNRYFISISALSEDLQSKYYKQKRTEAGILPEKIESGNASATAFKYRCKGVKKAFQEFSETERAVIKFWIDLLNEWQAERSRRTVL